MKKTVFIMALLCSTSVQPMKRIFNKNLKFLTQKTIKTPLNWTQNHALKTIHIKNSGTYIQTVQKKYYHEIADLLSFEELKKTNLIFQEFLKTSFSSEGFNLFMQKNCDYNDLKSMSLVLHEIIELDITEGFELFAPEFLESFIIEFIIIAEEKNQIPIEESIKTARMMVREVALDLKRKWPLIIFENLIKKIEQDVHN